MTCYEQVFLKRDILYLHFVLNGAQFVLLINGLEIMYPIYERFFEDVETNAPANMVIDDLSFRR